jgi:hypothetical protein
MADRYVLSRKDSLSGSHAVLDTHKLAGRSRHSQQGSCRCSQLIGCSRDSQCWAIWRLSSYINVNHRASTCPIPGVHITLLSIRSVPRWRPMFSCQCADHRSHHVCRHQDHRQSTDDAAYFCLLDFCISGSSRHFIFRRLARHHSLKCYSLDQGSAIARARKSQRLRVV